MNCLATSSKPGKRPRANRDVARRRRPAAWKPALAAVLAVAFLASWAFPEEPSTPEAVKEAQTAATVCPFCRSPLAGGDFCPRCGRLSEIVSTSSEHRFWADVPYVLAFLPQGNAPEIQSVLSDQGLLRESVQYASGDRYDLRMEKNGPAINGRVGWMKGGKETDYAAEMQDTFDSSQWLASRQVMGRLKGNPYTYLYRKLDYKHLEDGRLDRIQFVTSFYRGPSDWKKSPAAWLRHSAGEIVLRRDDNGVLTKIETSLREGKRSLRGEPEYGEPHLRVELVTREGNQITRVTPDQE